MDPWFHPTQPVYVTRTIDKLISFQKSIQDDPEFMRYLLVNELLYNPFDPNCKYSQKLLLYIYS